MVLLFLHHYMELSLIGSGKLGRQLHRVFAQDSSIKFIQWMNRSAALSSSTNGIELVASLDSLKQVDCYILAVNDESIEKIASQLPKKALVIHTSGGLGLNIITKHKRRGVFYPLQSFSMKRITNFSNLPICIEASSDNDLRFLEKLTIGLKANPIKINSQQRKSLHLAAVLVNNFTNHIFTQAEFICKQNDLSFDLLKPLIQETVNKLDDLKPKEAQTGPAIRGDKRTIEAHLEIIKDLELEKLYNLLTNSITNYYNK